MTIPHKTFGELSRAEKGELLLAHHEGRRIEMFTTTDEWVVPGCLELWRRGRAYRIAPEPLVPDSINWEHVAPEYNFMARDKHHGAWLYRFKPYVTPERKFWVDEDDDSASVEGFASYCRGTVDWKDSLVIRPGYEESA